MNNYRTIKELETELRKHPIGSDEYNSLKIELESKLLEDNQEKYEKKLVCFGSNHLGNIGKTEKIPYPRNEHFTQFGVLELPWEDWFADPQRPLLPVLNEIYPFTADGSIHFVKRAQAEYDLRYRQLVVVAYITDGEKVVVLQTNNNNRIAERLTFVQGHVEFSPDIYFHSELEYLKLSVLREIEEELNLVDKESFLALVPELPKFVLNRKENFADLEHYGVIYEVKVNNVDEFLSSVTSGEADKHTVTSISIEDAESYKGELDDWAYSILWKLNHPEEDEQ